MVIRTTRFGELAVDPADIITVSRGLIGFPCSNRFVLLDHAPGQPFRWLQSVDDPNLAFVVVDPYLFFPDYEVVVPEDQAERLGIDRPEEAQILTTVTIRSAPTEVTANLLGPLVIGLNTLRAEQMVINGERYATRHPLPLVSSAANGVKGRELQSVA